VIAIHTTLAAYVASIDYVILESFTAHAMMISFQTAVGRRLSSLSYLNHFLITGACAPLERPSKASGYISSLNLFQTLRSSVVVVYIEHNTMRILLPLVGIACIIIRTVRAVEQAPFTSTPSTEPILSDDSRAKIGDLLKTHGVVGYSLGIFRLDAAQQEEYMQWGVRTEAGAPVTKEVRSVYGPHPMLLKSSVDHPRHCIHVESVHSYCHGYCHG
jgi:hypothetical protein